ncbi:hypothetical protein F5878DRAFT_647299 [Lentinula raphanica]|uniref:Uncharacterized protein n=1 Tax=Lentinula raphanica TaxID=153919 RepID=A0AA38NWH9_9AGAR|nr:hypothetical protein F5880DRAFT_1508527 [Lentinula raphanica]KAJ3831835.1 hypothetical protein F5878DRAFT_647299 [Lentinula raphanica]
MAMRNPPPRTNFIASYAEGYMVFVAYPRFQSGLRVPPNQIFKLIKTKALDLHCFCGRAASAFQVTKEDSLLFGRFVSMCKRKDCKYFVDLTGAYDEASYLWPAQSSNAAPVNNATSSSSSQGQKPSTIVTPSSSRQNARATARSQRGVSRFAGSGTRKNPINLATALIAKRSDWKKLRAKDALYTFKQEYGLEAVPYPRDSNGLLKLPSQVWVALTDGDVILRCFHRKRVLVKPKAGNMNGPIFVQCPQLGFLQQLSIEAVYAHLLLLEPPQDHTLLSPPSSPIPHFTPSFNDDLYYAPYFYNYVPPLHRNCTNRDQVSISAYLTELIDWVKRLSDAVVDEYGQLDYDANETSTGIFTRSFKHTAIIVQRTRARLFPAERFENKMRRFRNFSAFSLAARVIGEQRADISMFDCE